METIGHIKNEEMRYKQRASWHDYRSPCFYMITIVKSPGAAEFSTVKKSAGGQYYCDYHPLGFICLNQINKFNRLHPQARIMNHAIMPDHLHFVIHVKEYLKDNVGLGRLVAVLKAGIRREYLERFPDSPVARSGGSVFESGFNDMICIRSGQLEKMTNYISDNPRRYFIKRENPDLFSITRRILIDGKVYSIIGNHFLLSNPQIEAVKFSSKFSEDDWLEKKETFSRTITNGGVLASPFIHRNEKEFLEDAIENGYGVILIENRHYDERSKPAGRYFDLCAEGRLLIISVNEDGNRKNTISREICENMNKIAKRIADEPDSWRLI